MSDATASVIVDAFLADYARVNASGCLDVVNGFITSYTPHRRSINDGFHVDCALVVTTTTESKNLIRSPATVTVALTNGSRVVAAHDEVAGHRFFVPELHFIVPHTELDVAIEVQIGHSRIELPLRITGGTP